MSFIWSRVYFVTELVTVMDVFNLNKKNESQRRKAKKQNDDLSIYRYYYLL